MIYKFEWDQDFVGRPPEVASATLARCQQKPKMSHTIEAPRGTYFREVFPSRHELFKDLPAQWDNTHYINRTPLEHGGHCDSGEDGLDVAFVVVPGGEDGGQNDIYVGIGCTLYVINDQGKTVDILRPAPIRVCNEKDTEPWSGTLMGALARRQKERERMGRTATTDEPLGDTVSTKAGFGPTA